jgi:hypothetical protein
MDQAENTPAEANIEQPSELPQTVRILSPEAQRALAEAEARRTAAEAAAKRAPTEVAGRGGLDPVRYGDWEIKGLTSDF